MNYLAESTDFVRFNQAKIRQPGSVIQKELSLRLIIQKRHAQETIPLSGNLEVDAEQVIRVIKDIRAYVPTLPDDPHLLYNCE